MSKRNVGLPELPPPGPAASLVDAQRRRMYEIGTEIEDIAKGRKSSQLTLEELGRVKALIRELNILVEHPANIIPELDGGKRRRRHTKKTRRTRKH
jgi:hypothetical protein